jgi:predicted MFS family arabinose efflux permease
VRVVVASLVGVAIAVGAVFGGIYKQPSPFNLVWVYAAIWLVLGIVVTTFVRGREPASQVLGDLRSDAEAG